ncbi:hypothetical protein AGDE_14969 [Angomonas deanei]|nr:hypothetical protein AGDE_14969 [Angomonas deanei]|eukprot:EPY19908.1 hypothetical protein AGDE_14969 [Angomonas deanei]
MFWDLLGLSSSLSGSLLSHAQSLHGGMVILKEGISTKTLNKFSTLRTSGKRSSLTPFRVERHHSAPVSAVCFHSSGEVCATGCWGGKLCLLNLSIIKAENIQVEEVDENGKRVPRSANPPQASSPYEVQSFQLNCAIRSVQFVPSMMILCAVACFDGDIYLFDHAARSQSLHIEHSHNHPMTAMAFSLDGRWMATADEQGSLHLSFAGVAGTVASIFNGHKGAITALQFDPAREDVLISAGEDCSVQMWSTVRKEKKKLLSAHGLVVTALTVSSAGDYFVSAAADGTAYVFKQNLEQPSSRKANPCESDTAFVPSFLLQHDGHRISMVTTALYDTRIIVGTVHGNLYVWSSSPDFSLRSGRLLHKVSVSRYCPYPIIAIDVNDGPLQTEPTPTTDALLREEPSKNRSKYAYITSMTFNGEIASFYIFDDSISHTFREKMLADAGFQGVREEEDYEEDEQKYVLPVTRSLVSWLGSKAEVQPLSKHMRAFRFGEELIDSFPLFARYKKSPPGRASDEKRSEGIQPIASQFSIGVGRRSLFLISHTDSYAATLTVHKRMFNIMNDEPFATELQLAEEEVFVAVSNCHRDESTPQLRFSVATSEGNIFNLHLLYNAESLCMVAESGVVAAQKYVRATVHSRLCLLKNSLNERVDGSVGGGESIPLSERLLVQCLDVSFPQECDTDDSVMYLFVGCDDGSTHLLVQQKEGEHVYFKELAVYYGSSSLSAITTVNCRDGSGLDPQPPRAPNFFWVVGDALGNVYQLCLETNFDAVPKEISELREKRNANESTPLELARLAVQHCMAAAPPTTIGPDHGQEASLAPELKEQGGPRGQYQNGWSWRSKNFGDWLTDVNFDAIESDLQTVNPPPTAVKKKRPVEEGCLSKHYRTDFNALLSEVAPNSTQLYNAPEEKPEDGFSFLAPIQLGEAHSFVQTDPIAEMDWLLTNGEGDVQLPLNEFQKAPSMLPSLVNKTPFAPVAETMSELQGTLPLANEAALTLQGKYDEEYHNGGEAQSPALCTETDLKDAVEVEEDYFAIINATVPTNLSLKEKREWCGKQNEVLREAFRVQKYNKEARGALEVYNKRAIQGAQLSF